MDFVVIIFKIKLAKWLTFNFYRGRGGWGGGSNFTFESWSPLTLLKLYIFNSRKLAFKLHNWTIKCNLVQSNSMDHNLHGHPMSTEGSIFNIFKVEKWLQIVKNPRSILHWDLFSTLRWPWGRIPLERYIFILNFSLPIDKLFWAHAKEIKHDHSPGVIVVLDPRYN